MPGAMRISKDRIKCFGNRLWPIAEGLLWLALLDPMRALLTYFLGDYSVEKPRRGEEKNGNYEDQPEI